MEEMRRAMYGERGASMLSTHTIPQNLCIFTNLEAPFLKKWHNHNIENFLQRATTTNH